MAKRKRKRKQNPSTSQAAGIMGRKGGKARLKKISQARRSEIARLAAEARWAKRKQAPPEG